jgi:hypothetical protein
MLRILRSLSPALAVVALAAPAAAHAAPVVKKAGAATSKKASKSKRKSATTKKKTVKVVYPTITSISPRKIQIGQKLTVKGTGFKPGKGKSSVAFYKSGAPVVFVKADTATATKLVVTVTPKVAALLVVKDDVPVATLLRLRIVGTKMSRTWTKNSRSPIVSPIPGAPIGQGGSLTAQQAAAQVYQTCQDTAKTNGGGDNDGDSIPNAVELGNSMDPCNADTDGDRISDGYEFDSAQDLNGHIAPRYPSTRPWPNPLDPTDINSDFDGDGLLMWQENKLWSAATGGAYPVTAYSDGTQNSGAKVPVTAETKWLDLDGDGNLTDDERDEDNDGLSNWVEFNEAGTQNWWAKVQWPFKPHGVGGGRYTEPVYTARQFNDVDATMQDTDGDGLADGADDQDNDGWTNFAEMQLTRDEVGYRVNPYNPCLPDPHAATCSRHVPLDPSARWAPWDLVGESVTSQMPDDAIPFSWPLQLQYSRWTAVGNPAPGTFPTRSVLWNTPAQWYYDSAWQLRLQRIHDDYIANNGGLPATPAVEDAAWASAFSFLPGDPNDPNDKTHINRYPNIYTPIAFGSWDPPGWFTSDWSDYAGGTQG